MVMMFSNLHLVICFFKCRSHSSWLCPTQGLLSYLFPPKAVSQFDTAPVHTPMSPDEIVRFTAAISICLAFLEPAHPSETMAQNMQEERITNFDKMITACRNILQVCGHPKYLSSIYELWHQASQSLYLLERMMWPEQPPETALHLILPAANRPLTDLMLDSFDEHHTSIFQAIPALEAFHTWFTQAYDTSLHNEFNVVLLDAMLLLRSVETLIRMKLRFRTARPHGPLADPIDLDEDPAPEVVTAEQQPAASSSTGSTLEWM